MGIGWLGILIAAALWSVGVAATPLNVVASFSILADMAREVGGEAVAVASLVGPDADAHVFEPSPADLRRVAAADLVLVNGLGFEGWIERLVRVSGYAGPVVVASRGVAAPGSESPGGDPHVWQDLHLGQRYVETIAAALAVADPPHAALYRQRSETYIARLEALDSEVRARLAEVPPQKRRVISSHAAFGYFARAYDVSFLAAGGLSTDSQPSARDLAELVRTSRREGVKAVFVENLTDPRLVEQVAREGGLTIGGKLYSDALSPPGGPAASYIEMFRHNVAELTAAMAKN